MRPMRTRIVQFALAVTVASAVATLGLRAQAPAKADAEYLRKAYDTYRTMLQASPYKAVPWQYLGPTNISGRATDIAVAERSSGRRIYVAYATSGVWKTDDNGATWQAVFEHFPSTSIGDLAVAPSNPDTVWVGTGEANIFRASMPGVGVYKSTDGGATFTHMGLTDTQTIARIVVHPTQPDTVYVAASGHEWTDNEMRGVFKTTDGGKTLEEGALSQPAHRRDRPRDGSRRPEHALRRDVAARAPQVERSARRARLQRGRHLEDDRRRRDVDRDQHRAPGSAVPRPHRHRHRAIEPEGALRVRRQLRAGAPAAAQRARRIRPSDQRVAHQGRRDLPHRRPGRDVAQGVRRYRGDRSLHDRPFRHVRLGVRPDSRRSDRREQDLHDGARAERVDRRRQDLHAA